VADAAPELFTALVAKDGGVDSTQVEADPTRRAIGALRAGASDDRGARGDHRGARHREGQRARTRRGAHEPREVEGLRAGCVKLRAKKPKPV